jgi:hypothetical protein
MVIERMCPCGGRPENHLARGGGKTPQQRIYYRGSHREVHAYAMSSRPWLELCPVPNVLFRPEEIHGASGIRDVVEPLPERNRYIGGDAIGLHAKHGPVTNFYADRESAIETRTIYSDHFPRKEPADRQRLKSSLSKPLLFTIHAKPVLGG